MKTPISVRLGEWFMDTPLPIPFKWSIGMYIKYRFTPDSYWDDLY